MFNIATRKVLGVLVCGLLLAACSTATTAQKEVKGQRQLESAACKLISVPPEPASGTWEAISVKVSTLTALKKTDNGSLQNAVRAYEAAAAAQNTAAMIHALTDGVRTCHSLGLKTGA
jgi:hypothetical protein